MLPTKCIMKTPYMELYKFDRGQAKNLRVLSYANDKETNINWPVEWVYLMGKERFVIHQWGILGKVIPTL